MKIVFEGKNPQVNYRRFSRVVITAMLIDENKRSRISFFCSSTRSCTFFLLVSLEVGWKHPIYNFIQTHFRAGLGEWLSYQDCKTELNMILKMFSFLPKDIVIHTISSILGTRNLLHFSAKGIEIIFVTVYNTVFLSFFFFFFKTTQCQFHWNACTTWRTVSFQQHAFKRK